MPAKMYDVCYTGLAW